ncbi:type II toxin-antitoxin system VapC family toxin [Luteolibacter sp. LG18]|uniref:type II toxin-antitoxin system VapC family toxin n=1 Tax=Luteolibacter sp. LG18 TaxID=2819286 RepID=UPI002B2AC16D|nr:ribonuclease VapC [Luteolibacter sp. LG18]
MLIDTDVLIWCLRGNPKALARLDGLADCRVSQVTRMELIAGCRDKAEMRLLKRFLADGGFRVMPLSEEIGHRADLWLEEHVLQHGAGLADCLIAATASLAGLPLLTGNHKHFRHFPALEVEEFRP